MTLDVPIFNEDGSVKFAVTCDEKQAQILMQFALNFLVGTGLMAASSADDATSALAQMELPLQ